MHIATMGRQVLTSRTPAGIATVGAKGDAPAGLSRALPAVAKASAKASLAVDRAGLGASLSKSRAAGAKKDSRNHSLSAIAIPDSASFKGSVEDVEEVLSGEELLNEHMRRGGSEIAYVKDQASKPDEDQEPIEGFLSPLSKTDETEVIVVGCGPAGMALAGELGAKGVKVGLVGFDMPWTNNYGVWLDEFEDLGLEGCVDRVWDDATCFFGTGNDTEEQRVGRAYARVERQLLRNELLRRCKEGGVKFLAGAVETTEVTDMGSMSLVHVDGVGALETRLVAIATGAAAGKFLKYEDGAPTVAAQTAYGIEADIEGYPFDPTVMHFMDYRRHHTGVWNKSALTKPEGMEESSSAEADVWGTDDEAPSFLYAMPSTPTRVFLEETCLTNRPGLPFEVLKRRLYRRMDALGITVTKVHDEEWSYIPVGGPLPKTDQPVIAFGAAANMVHPATGYSVARSMREAPALAAEIAAGLREETAVLAVSKRAWQTLWSQERKRQASFHVFGMELLALLDLKDVNGFFRTFFSLEDKMWQGFLGAELNSVELLIFAMTFFAHTSNPMRYRLLHHLVTHDSGEYMIKAYVGLNKDGEAAAEEEEEEEGASSAAAAKVCKE